MFRTINLESNKKFIIFILDCWGFSYDNEKSAVDQSISHFYDSIINNFPNAQLLTHGESVGLPKGQMGNSEVGHMNIGAGRIVFQELAKINKEIETGNFRNNKKLNELVDIAISNQKNIHLIGLLSDGGVHSHVSHLYELIDLIESKNSNSTFYTHLLMVEM